jgi:hypothetical protein
VYYYCIFILRIGILVQPRQSRDMLSPLQIKFWSRASLKPVFLRKLRGIRKSAANFPIANRLGGARERLANMQPFQAAAFCLAVNLTDVLDFDGCIALPINGLAVVSCPARILLSFSTCLATFKLFPRFSLIFRSDYNSRYILGYASCTRYLKLVPNKGSHPEGFLVNSVRKYTRLISVQPGECCEKAL